MARPDQRRLRMRKEITLTVQRDNKSGASQESPIESAFLAIRSQLARYVARMVTSSVDIDDILQETYLKASQCSKTTVVKNPRGYLYSVARSVALNDLAHKSRSIIEYIEEASVLEVESNEPPVDEQVSSRQRFEKFCDAVASLPPKCRRVFILRKVFGYTQKEIANEMGISESTVEKHLIKGFTRCRGYIKERAEFELPSALSEDAKRKL